MSEKFFIGVDIGGTKIATAIIGIEQAKTPIVLSRKKVPTCAQDGGAAVCQHVIDAVRDQLDTCDKEIQGIGISSAGVIDPKTGDVLSATELMPGWGGIHLAQTVSRACNLPCHVMGDVHAHAYGESCFGAGRTSTSNLVVAIGTGIGGAFFDKGTIMLGAHDVAGHMGHILVDGASKIQCSCGRYGHLEPIASGPGIVRLFLQRARQEQKSYPEEKIDGAYVAQLASQQDPCAVYAHDKAGYTLGQALGSLANAFDPQKIILSGSVTKSGDVWQSALQSGYASQAMNPVQDTPIVFGELGDDAPLIGAVYNLISSAYIS